MANPKRRHSNARTRTRRAHHALKLPTLASCAQCGAPLLPHRVCGKCGFYGGKQVMTVRVKEKKPKK